MSIQDEARAEAERRWPTDHREPNAITRAFNEVRQQGWVARGEWQASRQPEPDWEYTLGYVNYDGKVLADDDDDVTTSIDEARSWVQEALDSGQFSNAIVVGKPVGSPWVAIEKGGE